MYSRNRRFVLATLKAVFLGAVPAAAALPFRAIGSPIAVTPVSSDTVRIVARGHATHLGRYTSLAMITIVPQGQGQPPAFNGVATFVAANGDQLYIDYFGVVTRPFPDGEGEGLYEFTGGTGRFAGASGRGIFSSNNQETIFDGTIRFPIGE